MSFSWVAWDSAKPIWRPPWATGLAQRIYVLFATAIDMINTLSAARAAGRMKQELKKYTRPSLLILDELGFLPIDKAGADLLFQNQSAL